MKRIGTIPHGGTDAPSLRKSTDQFSAGGWTYLALMGTKGGFMIKEKGGTKEQKNIKQ